MAIEFKVVSGSSNVLLLIDGEGIPAQVVPPKDRDGNELYRFLVKEDRLRKLLPKRTAQIVETPDRNEAGWYYGISKRCSCCNKPLLRKLADQGTLRYCYYCGAKLVRQ